MQLYMKQLVCKCHTRVRSSAEVHQPSVRLLPLTAAVSVHTHIYIHICIYTHIYIHTDTELLLGADGDTGTLADDHG